MLPLLAHTPRPTVLNSVPRARYSFLIVRPATTLQNRETAQKKKADESTIRIRIELAEK